MNEPVAIPLTFVRIQQTFVAVVLPRVEQHAAVYFRDVRSAEKREEWTAEAVALAWKWHLRLVQRGKDPTRFPTTIAAYAARAVRCGRRLCGHEKARDVLSPVAQQRHGFTTLSLPQDSRSHGNMLDDALQDNTQTPIPDQVHFRLDFPVWQASYPTRDQHVMEELMVGERTLDVANKFGLSSGRVSQLRRDLHDDWQRFTGEDDQVTGSMDVGLS